MAIEKQREGSPRARMFVALDLPEPVRAGLDRWGEGALADPSLRRVAPEFLHITLAFLGQRPLDDVEAVAAALAESAGPAPLIELGEPLPRPPRRPRLFVAPALSPGAEAIQARLASLLAAARLYRPEKRPFWPHLTLARVRPEGRGSRRPMRVESPPGKLPTGLAEPFYGVRLTLYRSELQPRGARYASLAQVELPGGGRQ